MFQLRWTLGPRRHRTWVKRTLVLSNRNQVCWTRFSFASFSFKNQTNFLVLPSPKNPWTKPNTKPKTNQTHFPLSTPLTDTGILISVPSNYEIPPTNNDKAYQQNAEINNQRSKRRDQHRRRKKQRCKTQQTKEVITKQPRHRFWPNPSGESFKRRKSDRT